MAASIFLPYIFRPNRLFKVNTYLFVKLCPREEAKSQLLIGISEDKFQANPARILGVAYEASGPATAAITAQPHERAIRFRGHPTKT